MQTEVVLTSGQQSALEAVMRGESVFITGGAGTGKSHLIAHIREWLVEMGINHRITATTGVAACNIGGTTFHQMAGLGLGEMGAAKLLSAASKKRRVRETWINLNVLIIDEVSMMNPTYFGKVDYVARRLRKRPSEPFGGVRMVLVGDFFQLPPVQRGQEGETYLFESPLWNELNLTVVQLEEVKRQDDTSFASLLGRVRTGDATESDMDFIASLEESEWDSGPDSPMAVELFATNKQADSVNSLMLEKLPGETSFYRAVLGCYRDPTLRELPPMPQDLVDTCHDSMRQNNPVGELTRTKKEAEVMLCFNTRLHSCNPVGVEMQFFNGDRGRVVDMKNKIPIVRFYRRPELTFYVERITWELRLSDYSTVVTFGQMPLKLSWALTIHKAQGLTLSPLCVNIGCTIFSPGQAYVALSRAKSPSLLRVMSFVPEKLKLVNPEVREFYASLPKANDK